MLHTTELSNEILKNVGGNLQAIADEFLKKKQWEIFETIVWPNPVKKLSGEFLMKELNSFPLEFLCKLAMIS